MKLLRPLLHASFTLLVLSRPVSSLITNPFEDEKEVDEWEKYGCDAIDKDTPMNNKCFCAMLADDITSSDAVVSAAEVTTQSATPCVDGLAGDYPCNNVDLLSHIPRITFDPSETKVMDVWGWADSVSGREFAIVGHYQGTGFVEVSNPEAPSFLGNLPTHSSYSGWR